MVMKSLRVSDSKRYLVRPDGKPFFYLGDTAWELFHRLTREEADFYLEHRARLGFTVIQAVALAEFDGLRAPNAYGHLPLDDEDPTKPNVYYFTHVDSIVEKAESLGLFVGMLPTWGDKVGPKLWGAGPEVFDERNARAYGRFLGERYRDKPIIWILGGDRPAETEEVRAIWRAMAAGLKEGDGGRHLMTYHPMGWHSSSEWLHEEEWLDFNMLQSGHGAKDGANYELVTRDYDLTPTKPTLDGEIRYEDHPVNFDPKNGWFDEYDVRQAAWWGVLSGGCGVTYGCHDIWQFLDEGRQAVTWARTPWREAIELPGAAQMRHLRGVYESRPFLKAAPDQSVIVEGQGEGMDHVQAVRATDGSFVIVYVPTGKPVTVDLTKVSGEQAIANWHNPRDGSLSHVGMLLAQGTFRFAPPGSGRGNDWVLVLDAGV
jgi:hypothetical protein